jgi:hypothetical protein
MTGRNGVAKDDDGNVIDDRGASRTSSFDRSAWEFDLPERIFETRPDGG